MGSKMRVFHCFTITLKAMLWAVLAITGTALASQAPEQTSLRAEAVKSLEAASSAIVAAERRNALWIPAREAANNARAAFERGDYELAISQARTARRFAELGIRQLDFPPYRHFE